MPSVWLSPLIFLWRMVGVVSSIEDPTSTSEILWFMSIDSVSNTCPDEDVAENEARFQELELCDQFVLMPHCLLLSSPPFLHEVTLCQKFDIVDKMQLYLLSALLADYSIWPCFSDILMSDGREKGTHDIISVFIGAVPLRIQAEYVPNSSATGGLFIFLFFSGDDSTAVDFSKSAFVFLDQNTSRSGHVVPFQLPPGQYSVSAYDIEEGSEMDSGTLYPADTTVHSQRGTLESAYQPVMSSNIEDCNVTVTNRQNISTLIVSALCTHAANSPSSEAGFMMIVQRNDININRAVQLLVNETRQGSPEGPVSVEAEENGIYHVAIFPRNIERGIVISNLAYSVQVSTSPAVNVEDGPSSSPSSPTSTIIISVSVVLGVLMAVTLAVIILVARYKKPVSTSSMPHCHEVPNAYKEVNSEAKSPDIGVYAEIGDVKSSFSYTQNMLYESSLVNHTTQPLRTSMGGQQPDEFMILPSTSDDYEVDRLAQKKTEENDEDPFLVGQCSAYGTGPVPASDRSSLTQNVAYETTEAASRSLNDTSSDYEQLEQKYVEMSSDPYLVRQCSAYGSGAASNKEMN